MVGVDKQYWVRRESREQCKSGVKEPGTTVGLLWKQWCWSAGGAGGIPSVAVKCVDIRRNTGGEGDLLDRN